MVVSCVRFIKYVIVGGSTFFCDLCLLYFLVDVVQLDVVVATGVSFFIAVSINYVLSRHFVFSGTLRGVGSGYIYFMSIAGVGLLLVVGGMYVMTSMFYIHYMLSRIIVSGITGFWNYVMNLYVNFNVIEDKIFISNAEQDG